MALMVKDNSLYSWIFETETALKRDLTADILKKLPTNV